jgi:hypothetical protein
MISMILKIPLLRRTDDDREYWEEYWEVQRVKEIKEITQQSFLV